MPLYSLPSVYLGSNADARALKSLVETTARQFNSKNEFLKHCILYTLEHDPAIKEVPKKK